MNRKLHNTLLAFSGTGVMLFVGLVVAEPARERPDAPYVLPTVAAVVPPAESRAKARRSELDAVIESRIEARAKAFEAEMARTATASEALALTAGFLAATATEAALVGALSEIGKTRIERDLAAGVENAAPTAPTAPTAPASDRGSRTRDVIAVPYFSFARGSHRGSRS